MIGAASASSATPLEIGRASWRERGEIVVTGVQTCALPIWPDGCRSQDLIRRRPGDEVEYHNDRGGVSIIGDAVGDRKSVVEGKRGDRGDWSSDVCSSDLA